MRSGLVSELLAAAADFIAEEPKAAALFARKVSQILAREACHEEEEKRERAEELRRRGF